MPTEGITKQYHRVEQYPRSEIRNSLTSDFWPLLAELFPLDRAGRLARDVVTDAVDAAHFVADARRNAREQLVRKPHPIRGHAVLTFNDAEDDGVFVGALIAHHADGANRQKHGE